MAEIIVEEKKGLFVKVTCPVCHAEATYWTDNQTIASAGRKAFQKAHRKCKVTP